MSDLEEFVSNWDIRIGLSYGVLIHFAASVMLQIFQYTAQH